MNYEAPTISGQQDLQGALVDMDSYFDGSSDADIKHNIEPVQSTYQAPEISAQRDLDGSLQLYSYILE